MKKWLVRIILLALVIVAGIWVWGLLFPNMERQIRQRLTEVAQAASFGKESPLAQASNAQRLTTFCTEDLEIVVDLPGHSHTTISGRDELLQGALAARSFTGGLNVEFLDINVTVAPDKESAVADLTAKGKVPGDRDILVQELKFTLKRIGRQWYIQRVQTVKSLS